MAKTKHPIARPKRPKAAPPNTVNGIPKWILGEYGVNIHSPPPWYRDALAHAKREETRSSIEMEALEDIEKLFLPIDGVLDTVEGFYGPEGICIRVEELRMAAADYDSSKAKKAAAHVRVVRRGLTKLSKALGVPFPKGDGFARGTEPSKKLPPTPTRAQARFGARIHALRPNTFTMEAIAYLCWFYGWLARKPTVFAVDSLRKLVEDEIKKTKRRPRDPNRYAIRDKPRSMRASK